MKKILAIKAVNVIKGFNLLLQHFALAPYSSYLELKDLANIAIADCGSKKSLTISENEFSPDKHTSFLIQKILNFLKPLIIDHIEEINCSMFSPCEKLIVTASKDKTVRVTNIITRNVEKKYQQQKEAVEFATISSCGNYIATTSLDDVNSTKIINMNDDTIVLTDTHDWGTLSAIFSPCGNFIASVSLSGDARILNLKTKEVVRNLNDIRLITFSSCGKFFATTPLAKNNANVINIETGESLRNIVHDSFITFSTLLPCDKFIVTASDDGIIKKTNIETGNVIVINLNKRIVDAKLSSCGKFLATTLCEEGVKIININTKKMDGVIRGDCFKIKPSFSPCSKFIVVDSSAREVKLFNIETGKVLITIQHDAEVKSATFSSRGTFIATCSADNITKITPLKVDSDLFKTQNKPLEKG
jgi:WD40 repeat protein